QPLHLFWCSGHSSHTLLFNLEFVCHWNRRSSPRSMMVPDGMFPVNRCRWMDYIDYRENPFDSIDGGRTPSEGNGRTEVAAHRRFDLRRLAAEAVGRGCGPEGGRPGVHRHPGGRRRLDPAAARGEARGAAAEL